METPDFMSYLKLVLLFLSLILSAMCIDETLSNILHQIKLNENNYNKQNKIEIMPIIRVIFTMLFWSIFYYCTLFK